MSEPRLINSSSDEERKTFKTVRPHPDLPEFYHRRETRAEFVEQLFDNSAQYYDRISSVLSFGTDVGYRKQALQRAGLTSEMRMLDVATGTGLAAQAALNLGLPNGRIAGLDLSRGMLQENQKRHAISLVQGRAEWLPFCDASFDFICMGYALRHVEDLGVLFREFYRVLKPGGRVLILEITRPESRLGFATGKLYLNKVLPKVFQIVTRTRDPGRLLQFYWATIAKCVPPETILAALSSVGLINVERRRMGSVFSDYSGMKPTAG